LGFQIRKELQFLKDSSKKQGLPKYLFDPSFSNSFGKFIRSDFSREKKKLKIF